MAMKRQTHRGDRSTLRALLVPFAVILAAVPLPSWAAPGDISTKAGTVPPLARLIGMTNPMGIAHDAAGNLFIAEYGANRVRRMDTSGRLTTFAGTGILGYAGDGGPAREANLSTPNDVAVDPSGNVYIAERTNNTVRKVDTLGKISTFAGTGVAGFSGDGGPAIAAKLSQPRGVSADPFGNIYIADRNNNRIRRVDASGTITTFTGNGNCGYFGDGGPRQSGVVCFPADVVSDSSGNIFIADTYNSMIRKIDTTGILTTVAGNNIPLYFGDGLPATLASLNWPSGVAIGPNGSILIADTVNHRIRKVDSSGYISTLAGSTLNGTGAYAGDGGAATSAFLNAPWGIGVDAAGNYVIADTDNHRIRKVNASGVIGTSGGGGTIYGCDYFGEGGAATSASLCNPASVAFDSAGNMFIADRLSSRVRRVDVVTGKITTVAGVGSRGFSGDGGLPGAAKLSLPEDVAFDTTGRLLIADTGNNRIRRITPGADGSVNGSADETITTFAGGGVSGGEGSAPTSADLIGVNSVAVSPAGVVYFGEPARCRVRKIDGTVSTVAGGTNLVSCTDSGDGGPATSARIRGVEDVAVDGTGAVYIADWVSHRIRKIDPAGTITTVAGTGVSGFSGDGGPATAAQIDSPRGLTVSPTGELLIADTDNGRIRKVDSSGAITTVAGSGPTGNALMSTSGDGGPAIAARLSYPSGMAFNAAGDLFVADTLNDRVRRVLGPL